MKEENYIRFDWAAKRLLRNNANFDVLEGFLKTLLEEDIHIMEILESEANMEDESDKFNRVDIKAKNSKGDIIIIEIQNTHEIYYLERILYGVAKAITEHINIGDSYSSIKKIYSISIIYFDMGKGEDYIYIRKTPDKIFPEYYLIRVNEFNKLAVTPLEEWITYLKTGKISSEAKAPGLPEAREKLRYYDMPPQERQAYDRHLENIMIQNDVLSAAKEEGLSKELNRELSKGLNKVA